MTGKTFSASVSEWTRKSKARTEAVFKTAVQSLAEEANRPVSKGGKVRVDTGFLVNSFSANIGSMPSGPSNRTTDAMGNAGDVMLVIAGASIRDVIYLGWSANYARIRETFDGFRDSAAQQWPKFVRQAVAEAKRRIP